MRENAHEGAIIDPAIERREFLRRSVEAIGGGALVTALSAREAMGAVDLNRMKPEEALEALPDKFKLSNGQSAEVNKYPVRNPTQLAIILWTNHFAKKALKQPVHDFIAKNRRETGEVMTQLHRDYGVDHYCQEGYTSEEEIVRRIMRKKKNGERITADDIAEMRTALQTMKYYDEQQGDTFDANRQPEIIEYQLKKNLPPGIYDMIESGRLKIKIIAAERESTYKVVFEIGKEEAYHNYMRKWQTISRREQANLDNVNDRRDEFTAFGNIWASGHFRNGIAEKPKSIHERNQGSRGGKFCSAVVEMPGDKELDEFLKRMGKDYDILA
ncbi:MAG: hypothetical protein QF755_02650 [Candidatus Peribacteraceae bacterium]|jgi:hypothetical protein|nr:hypothetical protein [Candidatus Peribacteraceae bacterium]HCI03790.1 hypothetical protein [Candidatus Peribacteria bacterium]|tara:strand:+ start:56 stop:1039 length:984 start_codon:yes stop_codon:yes gene_type:complete